MRGKAFTLHNAGTSLLNFMPSVSAQRPWAPVKKNRRGGHARAARPLQARRPARKSSTASRISCCVFITNGP